MAIVAVVELPECDYTPILEEMDWLLAAADVPRLRGMGEFAEAEVIIPTGRWQGERFRLDRQPFTRLLYQEIDSGRWTRHVILGPSQSGKTLSSSIMPVLYHCFEVGEAVVYGVPTEDIVEDKWRDDLYPAIAAGPYAQYLPRQGAGSRGGDPGLRVTFQNGGVLRFMTGGGSDKSRAAYTARVLVVTETDAFGRASEASVETSQIGQLIARTMSYGRTGARIYLECTVSTSDGITWSWYQEGSASRIVVLCPACGAPVTPEREHLVGWQDAPNVLDAMEGAAFACPQCGTLWTEDERRQMNETALLVHKGQEVVDGQIEGALPRTDTLGFRWTAFNNLFWTAGDIASMEWEAARAGNEQDAEKRLHQFVWAMPYDGEREDLTYLDYRDILVRTRPERKGEVPADAVCLTMAADVHKRSVYWGVAAWMPDASPHVLDYGVIEVHWETLGLERALAVAFQELKEMDETGWPRVGTGELLRPKVGLVDMRYEGQSVVAACSSMGPAWFPARGWGASQDMGRNYVAPKQRTKVVLAIGLEYHIQREAQWRCRIVNSNVDYWKSWLHNRLTTAVGEAGALTLYGVSQFRDHMPLAKHFTSERQYEEFVAGKGRVIRWEKLHRNNHWLDVYQNCCCAAHIAGVRLRERANMAASAAPAQAAGDYAEAPAETGRRSGGGWQIGR